MHRPGTRFQRLPGRIANRPLTLSATVNLFNGPQPVYNMVPPAGDAAQFGVNLLLIDAFIDVHVRTGGDYGLTAGLTNTSTFYRCSGAP